MRLIRETDIYITRLLERLAELTLATETGAADGAALSDEVAFGEESASDVCEGRGVATVIDTWPRPMTVPDTVRLDCRFMHVDDVAFGAALQRLAANGEIEPGGFVDQRYVLIARHQIGFYQIGNLHRLAGAKLTAGLHADRAVARGCVSAYFGLRASLHQHVGRFHDFAALDIARQHRGLDGLYRRAGEAQLCPPPCRRRWQSRR